MTTPMPKLGRCPYCGRKLVVYTGDNPYVATEKNLSHTYCENADCCTNRDYKTRRDAINAANRRVT